MCFVVKIVKKKKQTKLIRKEKNKTKIGFDMIKYVNENI